MKKLILLSAVALITSGSAALADITILAWPGGEPEKALRKVVTLYNETQGVKDGIVLKLSIFRDRGSKKKCWQMLPQALPNLI